MLGNYTI